MSPETGIMPEEARMEAEAMQEAVETGVVSGAVAGATTEAAKTPGQAEADALAHKINFEGIDAGIKAWKKHATSREPVVASTSEVKGAIDDLVGKFNNERAGTGLPKLVPRPAGPALGPSIFGDNPTPHDSSLPPYLGMVKKEGYWTSVPAGQETPANTGEPEDWRKVSVDTNAPKPEGPWSSDFQKVLNRAKARHDIEKATIYKPSEGGVKTPDKIQAPVRGAEISAQTAPVPVAEKPETAKRGASGELHPVRLSDRDRAKQTGTIFQGGPKPVDAPKSVEPQASRQADASAAVAEKSERRIPTPEENARQRTSEYLKELLQQAKVLAAQPRGEFEKRKAAFFSEALMLAEQGRFDEPVHYQYQTDRGFEDNTTEYTLREYFGHMLKAEKSQAEEYAGGQIGRSADNRAIKLGGVVESLNAQKEAKEGPKVPTATRLPTGETIIREPANQIPTREANLLSPEDKNEREKARIRATEEALNWFNKKAAEANQRGDKESVRYFQAMARQVAKGMFDQAPTDQIIRKDQYGQTAEIVSNESPYEYFKVMRNGSDDILRGDETDQVILKDAAEASSLAHRIMELMDRSAGRKREAGGKSNSDGPEVKPVEWQDFGKDKLTEPGVAPRTEREANRLLDKINGVFMAGGDAGYKNFMTKEAARMAETSGSASTPPPVEQTPAAIGGNGEFDDMAAKATAQRLKSDWLKPEPAGHPSPWGGQAVMEGAKVFVGEQLAKDKGETAKERSSESRNAIQSVTNFLADRNLSWNLDIRDGVFNLRPIDGQKELSPSDLRAKLGESGWQQYAELVGEAVKASLTNPDLLQRYRTAVETRTPTPEVAAAAPETPIYNMNMLEGLKTQRKEGFFAKLGKWVNGLIGRGRQTEASALFEKFKNGSAELSQIEAQRQAKISEQVGILGALGSEVASKLPFLQAQMPGFRSQFEAMSKLGIDPADISARRAKKDSILGLLRGIGVDAQKAQAELSRITDQGKAVWAEAMRMGKESPLASQLAERMSALFGGGEKKNEQATAAPVVIGGTQPATAGTSGQADYSDPKLIDLVNRAFGGKAAATPQGSGTAGAPATPEVAQPKAA